MSAARVAVLTALLLGAALATRAAALAPITWSTIDGGGAVHAAGGTLLLSGAIGQHDAAAMTGGGYTLHGGFWGGGPIATLDAQPLVEAPLTLRFRAPAPNPVRAAARLSFDLPASTEVRIRVFDTAGRSVAALGFGRLAPGRHDQVWQAVDGSGRALSSGLYFLRLEAGESARVKRVMVLR